MTVDRERVSVRLLAGLPAYGPMATSFPSSWGSVGREGTVVEFKTEECVWVGNFLSGDGEICYAGPHPGGRHWVVIAGGDLWVVDPIDRSAEILLNSIEEMFEVADPDGWIFSLQGLFLARLGASGLIWHTRRISWDGFDQLDLVEGEVRGLAWSPAENRWYPFTVDTATGFTQGGCFGSETADPWEMLNP